MRRGYSEVQTVPVLILLSSHLLKHPEQVAEINKIISGRYNWLQSMQSPL